MAPIIVAPYGSTYAPLFNGVYSKDGLQRFLKQSKAHYITDGKSDEVEINAALEDCRATKTDMLLVYGDYKIKNPLDARDFIVERHQEGTLWKYALGKGSIIHSLTSSLRERKG